MKRHDCNINSRPHSPGLAKSSTFNNEHSRTHGGDAPAERRAYDEKRGGVLGPASEGKSIWNDLSQTEKNALLSQYVTLHSAPKVLEATSYPSSNITSVGAYIESVSEEELSALSFMADEFYRLGGLDPEVVLYAIEHGCLDKGDQKNTFANLQLPYKGFFRDDMTRDIWPRGPLLSLLAHTALAPLSSPAQNRITALQELIRHEASVHLALYQLGALSNEKRESLFVHPNSPGGIQDLFGDDFTSDDLYLDPEEHFAFTQALKDACFRAGEDISKAAGIR